MVTSMGTSQARDVLHAVSDALNAVLVCPRETVETTVLTFAAGGHVLLEDVPGVGKPRWRGLWLRQSAGRYGGSSSLRICCRAICSA